jgi:asparagine synthase (glutamine-hydrolysing)
MRDSLAHRGPDGAGIYVAPGVGLGSRRLAVLDLSSRGQMPMSSPDGRFKIVYNGEIYNYQELRRPLESRGHRFRSDTDTEVVLQLFAEEGPAMLDRLNGMFAFAIWDTVERQLFAARDRMGIKPFFYSEYRGALYFASEEKALFAAGVPATFDHGVWSELLCFRFVAGERTAFHGVKRLLPGHYLHWRDGKTHIRRWWNLADRARELRDGPPADPSEWYRETFDDAVRLCAISHVPLGVLLSGGLDSSTIAASLARHTSKNLASFTVGFRESAYDERPLARQVAEQYEFAAHSIELDERDLLCDLSRASSFSDQPVAHCSDAHLLAVAKHAKPRVTVLLSGEGADETLGGYVRYRPLRYSRLLSVARPLLRRNPLASGASRWGKLSRFVRLGTLREFILYNACDTLPEDLARVGLTPDEPPPYRENVLREAECLYPAEPLRQAMYSDQLTFLCSVLDRNDRMTMAASIECRVPFLDHRLVERLAALSTSDLFHGSGNKPLLQRSLGDRLPRNVLKSPKWGFGVPWKNYLRTVPDLRETVLQLSRNDLVRDSPIDAAGLECEVEAFEGGDDRPFPMILQLLLVTQAWKAVRASTRHLPVVGHLAVTFALGV